MVATFFLVSLAVWDRNKYGQHFPNNSPQTHISFHLYLQLALQEMTHSLSTIVRRGDRRIIMRVQIPGWLDPYTGTLHQQSGNGDLRLGKKKATKRNLHTLVDAG